MALRVTIRLDDASQALLEAEAARCGVSLGGLIRESAVRAARDVGREVSAGRVKLRARSAASDPRPGARRPHLLGREEPVVGAVSAAAVAVVGDGVALRPASVDPGVARALAFRRLTQR